MNDNVYGNARAARDPSMFISDDGTITRLCIRKATDIRMRTKKKKECVVQNQNLCGSNEGSATWKAGIRRELELLFANWRTQVLHTI